MKIADQMAIIFFITNQNHMISAIQNNEKSLVRNEDNVKTLKDHIQLLEKDIFILNTLNTAFIRIV